MTSLDQLREARRECPECKGPCNDCGIDLKYILIFYNSLWRECPDCRGLGIQTSREYDRACDGCGGSGDGTGTGLVPKYYDSDLELVGPFLRDWMRARDFKWIDIKREELETPEQFFEPFIEMCQKQGWLKGEEDRG